MTELASVAFAEYGDIRRLLSASEDDLYVLLSQCVHPDMGGQTVDVSLIYVSLFTDHLSRAIAVERGKEIFKRFSAQLRDKICKEWDYCARRDQFEDSDSKALAGAVLPWAFQALGLAANALTVLIVVALLLKMGLGKFCKCKPRKRVSAST
jgi:hypothetical protein